MAYNNYSEIVRGRFVIRIKIDSKTVYQTIRFLTMLSLALLVYVYDSQVYYQTILPLRIILDVCLFVFTFIPIYALLRQFSRTKSKKRHLTLNIKKELIYAIPLVNVLFIMNALNIEVPSLGSLKINMLMQSIEALPFFIIYLLASLLNGFMVLVTTVRKSEIDIYDIFIYSIVFMALQTIASLYGFHLAGVGGLRVAITCLFVLVPVIYLYCTRRFNIKHISIKEDSYFPLVIVLSIATFSFYYFNSLYNHYTDQGIMFANVNSILYRGNLEPYYKASAYYPAIGGFYVTCFIYTTGLNNVMLASVLAFTVAYILLPIVVYRLIKFVTLDSEGLALLLSAMSVYVDGIGIVALPMYKSKIDSCLRGSNIARHTIRQILNFKLSHETCSLYTSTISYLWFNPYKVFAVLASVTAIVLLLRSKKRSYELIFSGLLLAQSFINPRASFIMLLTSTILWIFGKLAFLEIIASILTCFTFMSPLTWTVIYKVTASFIEVYLRRAYELPIETELYVTSMESLLRSGSPLIVASIVLMLTYIYYRLKFSRLRSSNKLPNYTRSLKFSYTQLLSLFVALSILVLVFIILYTYSLLPQSFIVLTKKNHFLNIIRYLIFRYHIMIVLSVISLLLLKLNLRVVLLVIMVLLPTYFLGGRIVSFPISLAILNIPAFYQIVKHKRGKIAISILLTLYLILGTLTNGIYGCILTSSDADPIFLDVPHVINLLLKLNSTTRVCSGSYYDYRVRRTVKFANLMYSKDKSNCQLCLIDKYYGIDVDLNKRELLYSGFRLILLKLTEN